jgi:cytidylate kinase
MDEKPVNHLSSRRIGAYSNSLEKHVAEKTFEVLRARAAAGESFVVVGRCAEYVLRDNPGLIRIFVCGRRQEKLRRIMELRQVPEFRAEDIMREVDRQRKAYHNYYCDTKWGDARGYDMAVNSSKLGIPGTVDTLVHFIRAFREA